MSRAFFVCDVVLDSRGRAYPASEDVRNGVTGTFPCAWSIMPFADSRRLACGLAEVTTQQLNAIQADSRIRVLNLAANWASLTWGDLGAAVRNAVTTFLGNKDIDVTGFDTSTPLTTVLNLLCERARPGRTLDSLTKDLLGTFGTT